MFNMVDYYSKPWTIPINNKKNMIRLIETVNNPCIGNNPCKAIKSISSYNIQDITIWLYRYKANMAPSPSKVLRRPWTWTNAHALGKKR